MSRRRLHFLAYRLCLHRRIPVSYHCQEVRLQGQRNSKDPTGTSRFLALLCSSPWVRFWDSSTLSISIHLAVMVTSNININRNRHSSCRCSSMDTLAMVQMVLNNSIDKCN